MITYTPIALLSIVAFATVNFILLPIAYAKAYLHKLLIVIRQKKKQHIAELMFFFLANDAVPNDLLDQVESLEERV